MEHESPIMKAWREFALADPDDCDREWEAYLALVNKTRTSSVSSPTTAAATRASEVTSASARPRVPRSATPIANPTATAASPGDLSVKHDSPKDDLSPEARRIYDYIIGNSTALPWSAPPCAPSNAVSIGGISERAAATPSPTSASAICPTTTGGGISVSGCLGSAPASVMAMTAARGTDPGSVMPATCSTVCLGGDMSATTTPSYQTAVPASSESTPSSPTLVYTVPPLSTDIEDVHDGVDLGVADLAALAPTTCSTECPSVDAAALRLSATPNSSTTTSGIVPELTAPELSDKALEVDVTGDMAPLAAICLPAGPNHSIGGEDPMSVTPWNVHTVLNVPPRNSPRLSLVMLIVPELFPCSAATCSTDCSCRSIKTPSRLLPETCEEFSVVSTVNAIAPWPPPSCTRAGTSLMHGQDLCHDAQQKRDKEFLAVWEGRSPVPPPVQDFKDNQWKWRANWLEVREDRHQFKIIDVKPKPPWPPSLVVESSVMDFCFSSRMGMVVVFIPRIEKGQATPMLFTACVDMLPSTDFSSTRLRSWEGAMLAGKHWLLMRHNPSDWNSVEMELVLEVELFAASIILSLGKTTDLQPWPPPPCRTTDGLQFPSSLPTSGIMVFAGISSHIFQTASLLFSGSSLHCKHLAVSSPTHYYKHRFIVVICITHNSLEWIIGWESRSMARAKLESGHDVPIFWWLQFAIQSSLGYQDEYTSSFTIGTSLDFLEMGIYSRSTHYTEVHILDEIFLWFSTPILHAGKLYWLLGLHSSWDQFNIESATYSDSQYFEWQIPWYNCACYAISWSSRLWDGIKVKAQTHYDGHYINTFMHRITVSRNYCMNLVQVHLEHIYDINHCYYHDPGKITSNTLDQWRVPNCDSEFFEAFPVLAHPPSKALQLPWDPGDSFAFAWCQVNSVRVDEDYSCADIDTSQLPWDPGGSTRDRLVGKPNFKEGGLSATYIHERTNGPAPWATACLEARCKGGTKHISQQSGHNQTWRGTDRKGGFGRGFRLGVCCVRSVVWTPSSSSDPHFLSNVHLNLRL